MPSSGGAVDLAYPFAGSWLVQNSPANRVPSHGTESFATGLAVDFVPVDGQGRTARVTARTWVRPEPARLFPGFGRSILSPADGHVVAVHDGEEDHAAHRGGPSVLYALTQARRVAGGWRALAGNHVLIREDGGAVIALCHLRRASIRVEPGSRVARGQEIAACGNSGNSTEPHLHVQAMDHIDPTRAQPVPMCFDGDLPRNGMVVKAPPVPPPRRR